MSKNLAFVRSPMGRETIRVPQHPNVKLPEGFGRPSAAPQANDVRKLREEISRLWAQVELGKEENAKLRIDLNRLANKVVNVAMALPPATQPKRSTRFPAVVLDVLAFFTGLSFGASLFILILLAAR